MARLRPNFCYGQITDNPMPLAATVSNSPQYAELPIVNPPDYVALEMDPKSVFGAPEIMYVIGHAANSQQITVLRQQENTAARVHQLNEVWIVGPTSQDFSATGTPSTSNIGDVAATGVADPFAKSDHLHGRETFSTSLPSTAAISPGGTGSLVNPARHDHVHVVVPLFPSTSLPTDSGAMGGGLGTSLAASDHIHRREGFGVPVSSAITDRSVQGTGPQTAAYDHVHGREGVGTPGTSNPGDVAAQGSGPQGVFKDHQHAREPYGLAPTSSLVGDTANPGSDNSVARGGHTHGRPMPTHQRAAMDNTSPSYGPGSNLATVSGFGAPKTGLVTVPKSGIIDVYWGIGGWFPVLNSPYPTDYYVGIGWSTSPGVSGIWGGTTIPQAVGFTGGSSNWTIMHSGGADAHVNYNDSGVFRLTSVDYSGLVPGTAYYFYMLWGSTGASAMECIAGSRESAQGGTYIDVWTVA